MPQNLPFLLETLVDQIAQRIQTAPAFSWVRDEPTQEDLDHLAQQCKENSRFDRLRLKSTMLEDYKAGKAQLLCRRGPYAKVLVLTYSILDLPWHQWSAIFQAFGPPPKGKTWRVVWFANPTKRELPPLSQNLNAVLGNHSPRSQVGPEHVNGGYTTACDPTAIVIYRYEEASRVLLHELLHAACLDNPYDEEAVREALTETWAELFLIAVQARGNKQKARRLWTIQSQWIADQAAVLEGEYSVNTPMDYAWRYTVGRREILKRFGIDLPPASSGPGGPRAAIQGSLSFTAPALTAA